MQYLVLYLTSLGSILFVRAAKNWYALLIFDYNVNFSVYTVLWYFFQNEKVCWDYTIHCFPWNLNDKCV